MFAGDAVEGIDCAAAEFAEFEGEIVDIQADVLVHDLFVHFLGMAADEGQGRIRVIEGILHAGPQGAVDLELHLFRQVSLHGDATEGDGQLVLAFPVLTAVEQLDQALILISKAVFE